jgi:hypothetical protein
MLENAFQTAPALRQQMETRGSLCVCYGCLEEDLDDVQDAVQRFDNDKDEDGSEKHNNLGVSGDTQFIYIFARGTVKQKWLTVEQKAEAAAAEAAAAARAAEAAAAASPKKKKAPAPKKKANKQKKAPAPKKRAPAPKQKKAAKKKDAPKKKAAAKKAKSAPRKK